MMDTNLPTGHCSLPGRGVVRSDCGKYLQLRMSDLDLTLVHTKIKEETEQ